MFFRLTAYNLCHSLILNHNHHHKLMNNMFDTWFSVYLSQTAHIHSYFIRLLSIVKVERWKYASMNHKYNSLTGSLSIVSFWNVLQIHWHLSSLSLCFIGVIQLNGNLFNGVRSSNVLISHCFFFCIQHVARIKINPSPFRNILCLYISSFLNRQLEHF